MHRIIETPEALDDWCQLLRHRKLPMTVTAVNGKDRTLDQNALQWVWAAEAGNQLGETADEVQRRWKLNHGIPILCEDSEEYRQFCTLALKRLSYEERLEAMRYVPVTSEMKARQMGKFMDAILRECSERGIRLTIPDPERKAA